MKIHQIAEDVDEHTGEWLPSTESSSVYPDEHAKLTQALNTVRQTHDRLIDEANALNGSLGILQRIAPQLRTFLEEMSSYLEDEGFDEDLGIDFHFEELTEAWSELKYVDVTVSDIASGTNDIFETLKKVESALYRSLMAIQAVDAS